MLKKTIRKKVGKTVMTSQSPMYMYATEMVSSYYSKLSLDNKSVLTICGSGDQVLDAYFYGAKEVVSFDLNQNSFLIADLKFTAIKILSFKEFSKFFGTKHNNASLDYDLYKKIRLDINKKTRTFFDSAYKKSKYSGKKITKSEEYFRQRGGLSFKSTDVINIYLKNERNYLKLREIIKDQKLTFIRSDLSGINKKMQSTGKKFDLINISNVINYLSGSVKSDDPEKYIIDLLVSLNKSLKKNGRVIFYAYSPSAYVNGNPPASRKTFIDRIKKETKYTVEERKMGGISYGKIDKSISLIK